MIIWTLFDDFILPSEGSTSESDLTIIEKEKKNIEEGEGDESDLENETV